MIDTSKFKGIVQVRNKSTLIVPRKNMKREIKFLDNHPNLIRKNNYANAWVDLDNAKNLGCLKDSLKNMPALLIGKGPSLDKLTKEMIPESCVILTANEAIRTVLALNLTNKIYACQLDRSLGGILNKFDINRIVSTSVIDFYNQSDKTIACSDVRFHCRFHTVGHMMCLAAKFLGCSPIILTAFDGAYSGSCDYAKSIGYSSRRGGTPERFKKHKTYLESALKGVPHTHISIESTAQTKVISDTLLRLQGNLQEPCAVLN
jgi:hypothetical protein